MAVKLKKTKTTTTKKVYYVVGELFNGNLTSIDGGTFYDTVKDAMKDFEDQSDDDCVICEVRMIKKAKPTTLWVDV